MMEEALSTTGGDVAVGPRIARHDGGPGGGECQAASHSLTALTHKYAHASAATEPPPAGTGALVRAVHPAAHAAPPLMHTAALSVRMPAGR